ncbi:MAG: tRNA uridine-5-carboxymethylaminomethyl(34) synthesis GTPase MnmE [Clostridia bacterium]|nr:tRNA uridine-5-carboxymethylaminomethyl(34) synthesis GTPase MnmE [Clostridia bacterium]
MFDDKDTIAAVATSRGEGGIAIVRVSGDRALEIMNAAFKPRVKGAAFSHGKMLYGSAVSKDGREIDEVMAVCFFAPKSYTREDVGEIHTHGGISAQLVLERLIDLGARPAERGEFTYRAFLNGRISLDKAEAVMSLISAKSRAAQRSSLRNLTSGSSSLIGRARSRLMELVTLIDAAADFPEEIDEDVTRDRIVSEAKQILADIKRCADPRYVKIMEKGASVVIAGKPNVGKSSLMNALLSFERSIVTDIAGTTRDTINESASIRGISVTLTDTAGIRETGDAIEKMGVTRAEKCVDEADCVLLVLDSSGEIEKEDEKLLSKMDDRFILVANKDDISKNEIEGAIRISALTGEGISELTDAIYRKISPGEDDEKLLTLRQTEAARRAQACLERMIALSSETELDLMREDLTDALNILGEITGENITEQVIDGIFERFCVGK